jgi:hypothetical protein
MSLLTNYIPTRPPLSRLPLSVQVRLLMSLLALEFLAFQYELDVLVLALLR